MKLNDSGRFLLLLLYTCLPILSVKAQISISGKITDETKPLAGVRVDLRLKKNDQLLGYTFTNEAGIYLLSSKQKGSTVVQFKALNYEPVSYDISSEQIDTVLNVSLVKGGITQLQEVIIHSKKPYRIGKDTIELNASAFLQGDERTVEDLLKKVPGLNIGTDGSIRIGNKEVEKVMVEGDDFFEKGYRLLTQTMSVKPVDKIQVLQRYSNNKHLKGIENSDKVALNLQLKNESKSQWTGSISASGSVTKPLFYQAGVNLMNFGKKNKYYQLATANNNGVDAVSSINHLLYSTPSDEPGQIGTDVATPTLIDYTPDLPNFDYRRTNFNRDKLASFNAILNPDTRFKIKWMAFANPTQKTFYRNTKQQYDIRDIQFVNTEVYELNKRIDNYLSKIEMQYDVNSRSTLSYTGMLGSLGKHDTGNLLFNNIATTELTRTKGYLTNHNISYTNKPSDSEVLVSSARWIIQRSPLDYSLDEYYYEDLFHIANVSAVHQHAENNLQYVGITSHYVKRQPKGNFLELAFIHEYKDQGLNTDFVLQTDDRMEIRPAEFSNQINLRTSYTRMLTKYTVKRKKWEWTPQLHIGYIDSRLQSFDDVRKRGNWLISPGLLTKWAIYHKGKLEAELAFRQNNTQLMNIIPNYMTTGIRNFVKGMDHMATFNSSEGTLRYTHGNIVDRFFANASIGYKTMYDYIANQRTLNPNYSLTQQLRLKNKNDLSYTAQLNYYLKGVNGNLKLDVAGTFSDYETVVTGIGNRKIHSASYDYGLSFKSVWRSKINLHAGTQWTVTSFNSEDHVRLENRRGFLNLFYKIAPYIQANLKNEVYDFGDFTSGKSTTYYFSDFSCTYDAKRLKTKFEITAKNLFNNRTFRNTVITDTYQAMTEFRLLPRYIALGVNYSF